MFYAIHDNSQSRKLVGCVVDELAIGTQCMLTKDVGSWSVCVSVFIEDQKLLLPRRCQMENYLFKAMYFVSVGPILSSRNSCNIRRSCSHQYLESCLL